MQSGALENEETAGKLRGNQAGSADGDTVQDAGDLIIPESRRAMRVLAAEDNPVFQAMLKTMLTKWGYRGGNRPQRHRGLSDPGSGRTRRAWPYWTG